MKVGPIVLTQVPVPKPEYHIIFMFFPKCAPNGILGVEGTLAYAAAKLSMTAQYSGLGTGT
jgi:hypothetical protein